MKNAKKVVTLIMTMGVIIVGGCGRTEKVTIHSEIMPVKDGKEAIVTIVSDDGFYETGVHLNELATKYDLHLTVAGVVDRIEPHLLEWQEIEKQGYVELISHSWSHIKMSEENNYSYEELKHQIGDSINWFKEKFETDQIAFIAPENTMSELGYQILEENAIYAIRQGRRGYNSLQPLEGHEPGQWLNLYTYGIGDQETTEWRNTLVDNVILNGGWLIEMWHNVYVGDEPAYYQAVTYDMAQKHLEYISSKVEDGEIWNASLVEATKYLHEVEYAVCVSEYDQKNLEVKVSMENEVLDDEIFDYPLTVRIPVPVRWINKELYVVNDACDIDIRYENEVEYIYLNIIPNSDTIIIRCK